MENLLKKIIDKTTDDDLKKVAESISDFDLSPEDMEKNIVRDGLFIFEKTDDNENQKN